MHCLIDNPKDIKLCLIITVHKGSEVRKGVYCSVNKNFACKKLAPWIKAFKEEVLDKWLGDKELALKKMEKTL